MAVKDDALPAMALSVVVDEQLLAGVTSSLVTDGLFPPLAK
jgi:hypothetical protein